MPFIFSELRGRKQGRLGTAAWGAAYSLPALKCEVPAIGEFDLCVYPNARMLASLVLRHHRLTSCFVGLIHCARQICLTIKVARWSQEGFRCMSASSREDMY